MLHTRIFQTALALCALTLAATAPARTWTDQSGRYTVEAELVGMQDDFIVLKREDGQLAAVETEQLSDDDQEYLGTDEAQAKAEALNDKQQVWKTESGVEIPGNVVDYTSRELRVQHRRGRVYVNDRAYENMPEVYQKIVPHIVQHFEQNEIDSPEDLEGWLVHNEGRPFTYECDGVVIEMEDGDEYIVPFFLLTPEDRDVLRPGFEEWKQVAEKDDYSDDDYRRQRRSSYELQATAASRFLDPRVNQRMGRLQIGFQAVAAGVTSAWEVTLYPRNRAGRPLWVTALGRNSRTATLNAMQRYPGYIAGPVRQLDAY